MQGHYTSANEAEFFQKLQFKQEHELTALNDLLISEYENPDELYLVREYYEEYVIGHGIDTDGAQEQHLMCLSDALGLNLKEAGFLDKDLTLWEWLRACDYRCVKYNRNYDLQR